MILILVSSPFIYIEVGNLNLLLCVFHHVLRPKCVLCISLTKRLPGYTGYSLSISECD